ncbi:MAG: Amidase [Actinomycetia bacterium]|nr:Amidase [Actinomycetes bacterium]
MIHVPEDTVGAFLGAPSVLVAGSSDGPLAGRTLAVKDVLDVAGVVTGAGNPAYAAAHLPATANADAVDALAVAGATVVGKTITDELAYSLSGTNVHYGTPTNPAAPGRIPGGSSAGSVAAVAAGLVDLALGTDTGGSIRVPASYCGVYGWRPTHGAVSTQGMAHLAPSFDTVGLFARDAGLLRDAATVLLDGAGGSERQPAGRHGVRDVVLFEDLVELAPADVRAAVVAVADTLVGGAAEWQSVACDVSDASLAFRILQGREAWALHGPWIEAAHPEFGPGIAERFAIASRVDPAAVEPANGLRAEVRRAVVEATAGGRVLLSPAAAGPAPEIHTDPERAAATRLATLTLMCIAGLAGAPVVVLPLARIEGLPIGVAAMGAPGSDRALLDWAAASA